MGVVELRRTAREGRAQDSEVPVASTGEISLRPPSAADGGTLWTLAAEVGLDRNSSYAYLMWGEYFADSSIVAEDAVAGKVVGFVTGFHPPRDPTTLFVWQVGVAPSARGRGLAGGMVADLVARTGARYVEATVTPGNEASAALFRSIGTRYGAEVVESIAFGAEMFPDDHEAEVRFRIGPITAPS